MRPDIITCWPRGIDYPLWRAQLDRDRAKFRNVIIVITNNVLTGSIVNFLREQMPTATFVQATGDDWYESAIRAGLSASDAEWVLFTEQDFFYPTWVLDWALDQTQEYVMVTAARGPYPDPGFTLIRRDAIDAAEAPFGLHDGYDNFRAFGVEMMAKHKWVGLRDNTGWYHMNGLTSNHTLIAGDNFSYVHEPRELRAYFDACLQGSQALPQSWRDDAEKFNAWYDAQ